MKLLEQINERWQASQVKKYLDVFLDAWGNRAQIGENKRNKQELDFLPAALEVLERPPSPTGRNLGTVLIALFSIAILWASVGELEVVAVAEGKIISSGRIKDIQPLEKGVVKAILVKEGQRVKVGEPLIELDQTLTQAEQVRISQELRYARLNLLREQSLLQSFSGESQQPQLTQNNIDDLSPIELTLQSQLLEQEWLDYQAQTKTYQSQKRERQASLQSNQAMVEQLQQTIPLVNRRVAAAKDLSDKKMLPEMEYLALEQSRIEQQQSLQVYLSQQSQYQATIETAQQQLNTLKADKIHQVLSEIEEYQRQTASLDQQLAKAQDVNARQLLAAPVDGKVQQLAIHTIGGVVTEAQVLMKIVPEDDYLEVEAVLENKDIGFVFEGQSAEVKVNTFNFTKYGVIDAEVVGVTGDAIIDEVKGLVYKLRLKINKSQMQINGRSVDLLPGMSVVAEVKTDKRKIIEYVLSPLLRKTSESVRER